MGIEITELQAVDVALGSIFAAAYTGLGATGPENFKRFCARPMVEKVFRTQVDTPDELVRKIAAAKKGKGKGKVPPTPDEHAPDLPAICFYRKPGMTNGNDYVTISDRIMTADDGKTAYRMTICPVALDYTLLMLAWDKPTLDKLQIGWYAYTIKTGRAGSRFVVPYLIGGKNFDVPAWITAPRSILFQDASMPMQEGRLFAVTCGFTVATNVLVGEQVTVNDLVIQGGCRQYIIHGPREAAQGEYV